MKGLLFFLAGFVLLPGSVYMLLAANFGALKGYLIAGVAFFGFLILLSATWSFGLPETPALTGPKGTDPSFKPFAKGDAVASKFGRIGDFQGSSGNGWSGQPAEPTNGAKLSATDEALKADLDTAKQAAVQTLIDDTNKNIKDSSKELDVTNLDPKVFYTIDHGTTVVAIVISPKEPPQGSGLEKPTFAPITSFAYKDPGAPKLPSLLFLGGAILLFALHVVLLGLVERRRPLGKVLTPTPEARAPARV